MFVDEQKINVNIGSGHKSNSQGRIFSNIIYYKKSDTDQGV